MLYKLTVPGGIDEVEEVRVLEWHGGEGTAFAVGDLVVELETHKAVVEVRAGRTGTLRVMLCGDGDWRKLGEPLAIISDTSDEAVDGSADELAAWSSEFEIV